jgi:hypothetical protein
MPLALVHQLVQQTVSVREAHEPCQLSSTDYQGEETASDLRAYLSWLLASNKLLISSSMTNFSAALFQAQCAVRNIVFEQFVRFMCMSLIALISGAGWHRCTVHLPMAGDICGVAF